MAGVGRDASAEGGVRAPARECGACALCCTVLRVDALRKPAHAPCAYRAPAGAAGGCGIHPWRPGVCRAYRCLWLRGGLEESDRPDGLGALLDLSLASGAPRLEIREATPGAFERSPRLREIAEAWRRDMPVRVTGPEHRDDAEAPARWLLPGGEEQEVAGDRVRTYRKGRLVAERRAPRLERLLRRLVLARRRRRVSSV